MTWHVVIPLIASLVSIFTIFTVLTVSGLLVGDTKRFVKKKVEDKGGDFDS